MGRRPLDLEDLIQVGFRAGVLKRIDAVMGPFRRGVFIRAAVDRELARIERKVKRMEEGGDHAAASEE